MSWYDPIIDRLFGRAIEARVQEQLASVSIRIDDSPGWDSISGTRVDRPWADRIDELDDALECRRYPFDEPDTSGTVHALEVELDRRAAVLAPSDLATQHHHAAVAGIPARQQQIAPAVAIPVDHLDAGDEIGVSQPHLTTRPQTEKLLRRILHEIVTLDIKYSGKRHKADSHAFIFRVVDGIQFFHFIFGIIGNDHA